MLFGGRFADPASWLHAGAAFVLFSAVASAAYVENDLLDRDADRQHPKKRLRPLAAGTVPAPSPSARRGAFRRRCSSSRSEAPRCSICASSRCWRGTSH
jgi:hypothetical protein